MNEVSLSSLTPGDRAVVKSVETTAQNVRQRLLEMGIINGTPVELVRYAPMGDPIEVRIRGYRLSLRRVEAQAVMVLKEMK